MKIAHVAIATPRLCGLYETTRDLAAALRKRGHEAFIVDPKPRDGVFPETGEDRGVPVYADYGEAVKADVIVSHSGHDGTPLSETSQPIVHVAHGRPESTFLGECEGGAPGMSYQIARDRDARYKAVVTFWTEHEAYLRNLWRNTPVYSVRAPVDTSYWKPGETDYDFAGKRAKTNIVIADPWIRARDRTPFDAIHGVLCAFKRLEPDEDVRLHVFGLDSKSAPVVRNLLTTVADRVGVLQGWASDLRAVYRATDVVVTPHEISTRTYREALACGAHVVRVARNTVEQVGANVLEAVRKAPRRSWNHNAACFGFDANEAAREFEAVLQSVVNRHGGALKSVLGATF